MQDEYRPEFSALKWHWRHFVPSFVATRHLISRWSQPKYQVQGCVRCISLIMDLSNETNVWKQALLDIPVARKLWSARIEPKARDNQLRIGLVDIRMTSLDEVV